MNLQRLFIYVFFGGLYSLAGAQGSENLNPEPDPVFHHNLKVFLDPKSRQINVEDTITIPDSYRTNVQQFRLNSDLTITDASVDVLRLSNSPDSDDTLGVLGASTSAYSARNNARSRQIRLIYNCSIYDLDILKTSLKRLNRSLLARSLCSRLERDKFSISF